MPSDAVLSELADTFSVAMMDEDTDDADTASVVSLPKRKTKVGRARFADDICDAHPVWHHDDGDTPAVAIPHSFPCAKFSGLPGKGRGIKQPSIGRIIWQSTLELGRPLFIMGLLVTGLYGFNHFVLHGGGNVLRPGHSVSKPNPGLSNVSKPKPTDKPSSPSVVSCSRIVGNTCFVSPDRGVKK